MTKYEQDTERWLRSQAKVYALRQNFGMAATFERCADEVKGMREQIEVLKKLAMAVISKSHHKYYQAEVQRL